jgi:hypothetical protein
MPRSKKPRPTFDVARTELSENRVGWVYRSEALDAGLTKSSPSPEPSVTTEPAPPESRTWIETGVSVMVLPLSLTLVAMVAPMYWLLSSRDSQ